MDKRTKLHQEVGLTNLREAIVCQMALDGRVNLLRDDFSNLLLENPDVGHAALLTLIKDYKLMRDYLFNDQSSILERLN